MSCSEKPDDLNCQFDESYENSISEAIRYFIEPDAEEGQPIVLCPNLATSTAFESMELTKKRLRRTGAFLNESKPYLRYLVENTDKMPQCSKCRKKTESSPEYKQFYLQSMHNSLLILDDELKQKAETELGSSSEVCKCKELIDSRKNFNLLKKRFLSMFLWNYLLSTTDLSSQQKEIINKSVPNKYNISGPNIKKEDEIMRKRARPKSLKIELRDGVKRKRGRPKQVRSKENEARQNTTKQCIKSVTLDINEDCSNNINEATGSQTIAKIESERSLNTNLNTSNLRRSRRSCVLRKKSLVEESDTSS